MFVTHRPCGAKAQVKGAQGPVGRPNPMADQPDFVLVQVETWWICSQVGSQEEPMPKSWWKPGGVADQPRGGPPGHPSPPDRLN
jgi:hypothetical protein